MIWSNFDNVKTVTTLGIKNKINIKYLTEAIFVVVNQRKGKFRKNKTLKGKLYFLSYRPEDSWFGNHVPSGWGEM